MRILGRVLQFHLRRDAETQAFDPFKIRCDRHVTGLGHTAAESGYRFIRSKRIGTVIVAVKTEIESLFVEVDMKVKVCGGSVLRPLLTVEGESTGDLFCAQSVSDRLCDQRCRHITTDAVRSQRAMTAHMYSMPSGVGI